MRRFPALILIACLLTQATGCGFATRLAYNHLDWIAFGRIDDYVDLERAQRRALEGTFNDWWHWHRRTQMAEYADFLRELATALETGWTRAQLGEAIGRVDVYYDASVTEMLPFARQTLAALSDEQVAELLENLDERAQEYAEGSVELSEAERRERSAERARDSLADRLGRLTPEQRLRIDAWSATREDLAEQWLLSRRAWRDDLAVALQARQDADFEQHIRPLFLDTAVRWPPAHRAAAQRNLEHWLDMVHDVLRMKTPDQHDKLLNQLLDFAADAERLSRQPHD